MHKKLIIYSPFAVWDPHFETDLELAQIYVNDGYEVTFLCCMGDLPSCAPNPFHYFEKCWRCRSRFNSGMDWLNKTEIDVQGFYNLTDEQKQSVKELREYEYQNIEDVKNVSIDNADIGMAALSSVVSILREPYPDFNDNLDIIRKNIEASAVVYYSLYNHLREYKPDIFIMLNGRFSALRPALRAAQALGIESYIHERAAVTGRYSFVRNSYVHDLNQIKEEILTVWNESRDSEQVKNKIAREWFRERLQGVEQAGVSYEKRNIKNKLPASFDSEKINIGVFISSEDEYVAVEDWNNPHYKDQNDGILKLLSDIYDDNRFVIYIRVHPNLSSMDNSQTRGLHVISQLHPAVNIIKANDDISSYALVKNCTFVITYGSTIGIEAVYLDKPSILMGRTEYEDLGGCIRPDTHMELIKILKEYADTNHLPSVRSGDIAISMFGYYMKCKGVKFKYVREYSFRKVSMLRSGKKTFIRPNIVVFCAAYFILSARIIHQKITALFSNKTV